MRKIIFLILTLLWISFIFYNSFQTAIESSQTSSIFVNLINDILENLKISIESSLLSFMIRKLAHMFEFYILTILLYFLLMNIKKYKYLRIISLCLLIAIMDEGLQLFIEGRSGSIYDVFIDVSGAILGLLTIYIIIKLINYKKYKTILNNN